MCNACPMHICTGLVGPKSENVEKTLVFKNVFEGSKRPRGCQGKFATERAEQLFGHFGATFGPLWASSGAFGSLNDYFGIIVKLLWV